MRLLAAACVAAAAAAISVTRMRVEYLTTPIGIDDPNPRFSWALADTARGSNQSAYQILVAPTTIGPVTPIWNSGRVASSNTLNIAYNGSTPLASDSDYTVFVQVFDGAGTPSAQTTFSTGILAPADWQGAAWVAPAPGNGLLYSTITLPAQVTRARLYISGLGYYKAWINGLPIDDHQLGSFTTFQKTVTYDVVDVSALLVAGCNTLTVSLGNGWWSQPSIAAGAPQLFALLSVKDVNTNKWTFVSSLASAADASAEGAATPAAAGGLRGNTTVVPLTFISGTSPVVMNDIYNGETYDARLVQQGWQSCSFKNASAWAPAVAPATSPATYNSTLRATSIPIVIDRDYAPADITQPLPGVWVFDFGQNMAGITTLAVPDCPAGTVITMRHAEILHVDGTVNDPYSNANMTGTYICAGTGGLETYTSQFTYYGFRYVQISGLPGVPGEQTLAAHFLHSDNPQTGSFSSSSPILNAIQHATRYAALSNQMDVPTDCPQRERRGWLGDAQLSCETNIHNLDMGAFYTKWLRDIRDTQAFDNAGNAVPDCAPFYGHGHTDADPGWGIAYFAIPNWVSDYYADDRIVEVNYPGMRAYLESWLANHYNVTTGLMPFCLWGDWCPAEGGCFSCVPEYGSFFLITALDIMTKFATKLGNAADAQRYGQLSTTVRAAYQAAYWNPANSWYGDGSGLSQMFALTLGLNAGNAPAAFARMLAQLNNASDHNVGGIISTKLMYPLLDAYGYNNMTAIINLQTTEPSYGYWLTQGATTLWESWTLTATSGTASYNHIMFGGAGSRYYTNLAGIQRTPGAPSWTDLTYALPTPETAPGLTYAAASIDTPMGLVASQWAGVAGYNAARGACGMVAEHSTLALTCKNAQGGIGPGVFTNVSFASFGTPSGSCDTAFQTAPTCNAPTSASVVAAACIGKSQCSIDAEVATFGGTDPCYDVFKALAVALTGNCAITVYTATVTVPVNAVASVVVPLASLTPASATVQESGTPVWSAGSFIPGAVTGITGATVDAANNAVAFAVGSGTYSFEVLG